MSTKHTQYGRQREASPDIPETAWRRAWADAIRTDEQRQQRRQRQQQRQSMLPNRRVPDQDLTKPVFWPFWLLLPVFILWVLRMVYTMESLPHLKHVRVYPIGHPEWAYDYPIVGQDMCSPCPYCNYDDVWSRLPTLAEGMSQLQWREWSEKDEVISQERDKLWARLPMLSGWHDIFQWHSERLHFLMYTEYYRENERMTEMTEVMTEKMSDFHTVHQFDWYDPWMRVCYC
jgi:hypothetical protein